MQSIEEAAEEYLKDCVFERDPINAFRAGVEFAQQWHSVEKELPTTYKNETFGGILSDYVICKLENDKYCIARIYTGKFDGIKCNDWIDSNGNYLKDDKVISWKPIQLN